MLAARGRRFACDLGWLSAGDTAETAALGWLPVRHRFRWALGPTDKAAWLTSPTDRIARATLPGSLVGIDCGLDSGGWRSGGHDAARVVRAHRDPPV